MSRTIKTVLTFVFLAAIYVQAADVTGEYCNENKEEGIKLCYQFKAGKSIKDNKVTFVVERENIKTSASGRYVQTYYNDNRITLAFDKVDDKNALLALSKKMKMKDFDNQIAGTCAIVVAQRQRTYGKFYPQTPQGIKDCIKDGNNDAEIKYVKQQITNAKLSDSDIQRELNSLNSQFGFNLLLVGNTMHKLDEECDPQPLSFTKKGAKASTLVFDKDKQFCLDKGIYDKCDGSKYDPKTQVCKDNTVLSKCKQELYNPDMQYCPGGVLKDKGEFTDSRDGKIYKTVTIGPQTWMAENLNYGGESGKLGKCYKGAPENCEKYGRFYDWTSAMNLGAEFRGSYKGLKDSVLLQLRNSSFFYYIGIEINSASLAQSNESLQKAKKYISEKEYGHISTMLKQLEKMRNEIMKGKGSVKQGEHEEYFSIKQGEYQKEVDKYRLELSKISHQEGICPEGWRLPNIYDFKTITSIGDKEAENLVKEAEKKIKEALEARGETKWTEEEKQMLENAKKKAQEIKESFNKKLKPLQLGGTDEYGINAKPGGRYEEGAFQGIGEKFGDWWSSEEYDRNENCAYMLILEPDRGSDIEIECSHRTYKRELGHIRCIKEPEEAKKVAAKSSAPATLEQPAEEPIEEGELYPKQDAQPISTNIPQKENKTSFNKSTIIGIAMAAAGAGLAAYGFLCDKNTVLWYENDYQNQTGQQARDIWQIIQDAQKIRNMSYGAGGALFLSGLGVTIFF